MLPISIILKELENVPISVIPILNELHRNNAHLSQISKVDLKHLTSRTLNLCKANEQYKVWCGVNIISVLIENAEVLSSFGSLFFTQLLKVLQTQKDRRIFRSTVQCLNKLSGRIRGKPTLTREILTPNLSSLISLYLDKLLEEPALMNTSLRTLVENHPTTSRPFANKIKAKLLEFMAKDDFLNCPESVQKASAATLATLPVVEKDGPSEFWNKDVRRIVGNIASAMLIFESFLQIKDDEDTSKLLLRLNKADEDIFGPLRIDVNHPVSILTISSRIELLLLLLLAYVSTATQFSVNVPIGMVISVAELMCSINTKFMPFKREIRDAEVKEMVNMSLLRCHHASVKLLSILPSKYGGFVLSHLVTIISFLELTVFLQGRSLDYGKILTEEEYCCDILLCVSSYISLVGHYQDHALMIRFVELAIFLIEPRKNTNQPKETKASHHSKSSRKRAKNGATPLADILSHEHLFLATVPESTRKTVFAFFTTIIPRVSLAPTQYNKLVKAVMVEAVKLKDHTVGDTVPRELKKILTAIVLTPAPESASILPIASSILWDDELLSVFNNPRFPQLPVKVNNVDITMEEDEIEVEDTTDEPELKKRKLEEIDYEENQSKNSFPQVQVNTPEQHVNKAQVFTKDASRITETTVTIDSTEEKAEKEVTVEEHVMEENTRKQEQTKKGVIETATEQTKKEVIETVAEQQLANEEESDDGSEIEIPDLDLDDSEEET